MEIWKNIKESNYSISSKGSLKNLITNRIINGYKNPSGYIVTTLTISNKSKPYSLHRLVATYFIPNPLNKPLVNHIDGVKNNNFAENLEWCTHQENMIHAKELGLMGAPRKWDYVGEKKIRSIRISMDELQLIKRKYPTIQSFIQANLHKLKLLGDE